jgi:minor extracellular serine protease Vpr
MRFCFLLFLLGYNFTVLAQATGNLDEKTGSNQIATPSQENQKNRYFIEFYDDLPLATSKKKNIGVKEKTGYRISQQNRLVADLAKIAPNIRILSRLTRSRNAIVTMLDANEYEKLIADPRIKRISPSVDYKLFNTNQVTQTTMNKSLVSIGNTSNQGHGVVIAIMDSGVDYTHPDLGGCVGENCKVIGGYDFFNDDDDPMDSDSHGTAVAGIVAQTAPLASIFAYKVCNIGICYDHLLIQAIEAAMDPNDDGNFDDAVNIINISFGKDSDAQGTILEETINAATEANILVVVGAGNDGSENFTLGAIAAIDSALTVAASTDDSKIASFSSRGHARQNGHGKPDIAAPGVSIQTTGLNGSYQIESGTSLSAPAVSGAAAILLADKPYLKAIELKALLMGTATDLNDTYSAQGMGLLNLSQALQTTFLVDQAVINLGWFKEIESVKKYRC